MSFNSAAIHKSCPANGDAETKQRRMAKTKEVLKAMPKLKALNKKLLALGGDWVALQNEIFLKEIMERGKLVEGKARLRKMEMSMCHSNSAMLWAQKPKTYRIMTGWALSDDGIWRQHSWVMNGNLIIETTEKRTKYYGTVLTDEEAISFMAGNCKPWEGYTWPAWLKLAYRIFIRTKKPFDEAPKFIASLIPLLA